MTDVRTEDWLTVEWTTPETATLELPGVSMFAHWARDHVEEPTLSLADWPSQTRARSYMYSSETDHWTVWTWDFHILALPRKERWPEMLRETMRQTIDAGALLAYCGWDWGDPRTLFDPTQIRPPMYACMTCEGDFVCASQLGEPLQRLDPLTLAKLHKLMTGSLP